MSKHYFLSRLSSIKAFWQIRKRILAMGFNSRKMTYHARHLGKTKLEELSSLKYIMKQLIVPIASAVGFVALLYLLQQPIESVLEYINSHFLSLSWLLWNDLDKEAYLQLLNTVAAVSGVFLALYFTAVTTVASNVYSSVPSDVRQLMLRDRLGNVYVKVIAFLTTVTLIFLFLYSIKGTVPAIVPALIVGLSIFSVYAFTLLGLRTFYFADPTTLADIAIRDFFIWVNRASVGGWRWKVPEFQEHYRKQALKSLNTLSALAEISQRESHLRSESFPRLIQKLIMALLLYESEKYMIPTESRWFSKKHEHKQWYLSESTDIETASQTDSPLSPKEIVEINWVEDLILDSILDIFRNDVEKRQFASLLTKLQTMPELFEAIGRNWDISFGLNFIKKLSDIIDESIYNNSDSIKNDYRVLLEFGLMDMISMLPLSLELGFVKSLDDLSAEILKKKVNSLNPSNDRSPYTLRMPVSAVKVLEELHNNALFEIDTKSSIKTPKWYVSERIMQRMSWETFNTWTELINFFDTWYAEQIDNALNANLPECAASIQSRALELSWKINRHSAGIEKYAQSLENGKLLDLTWPDWKWEDHNEVVKSFRNKLMEDTARTIPPLIRIERSPDVPDHLGASVHWTGKECFNALAQNDQERFRLLYGYYFLGVIEIANRVRPQVLKWEPSNAITWYTEPLVDLLDISGYAYIFSELHQNSELWNLCKGVWDAYVSADENSILQQYALISQHRKRLFSISPRAVLRTNRLMRLIRILSDLPRAESVHFYDNNPVEHPSEFIRRTAPARDFAAHYPEPMSIFTAKYFMKRPAASEFDFDLRRDDLVELGEDDDD